MSPYAYLCGAEKNDRKSLENGPFSKENDLFGKENKAFLGTDLIERRKLRLLGT
jgi:hypothetical protein